MRNNKIIVQKLDEALDYLYKQEQEIKPFLEILNKILLKKIKQEEVTIDKAFEMYHKIHEQYTNSVLLITKIKEIIEFKL